jgi:hypothetical protein
MTPKEIIESVAEEIGGDVRYDYSGRGMYGTTCMGIACSDYIRCIEVAASNGLRGARFDNMGKKFIVYWPDVEG